MADVELNHMPAVAENRVIGILTKPDFAAALFQCRLDSAEESRNRA